MDTPALPYTIVFTCGTDQTPPLDVRVVDITPSRPSASAVLDRITEAGLSVADVKADVLIVFGSDDPIRNLVVYTAMIGLSGRRPDIAVGTKIVSASALHDTVAGTDDAGPPPSRVLHVQVGQTGRTDLPEYSFAQLPTDPRNISMVKYAKRCRLVPPADPLAALQQLVALSAIRKRGDADRLPFLVRGDEPPPTEDNAGDPVGIDLEKIRRDAVALRRTTRTDDRSVVVDRVELSDRQRRLLQAADVDVASTLSRLGARFNPDEGAWHCPRPDRHANGDASPSLRVADGKVRCGRCDDERVDSLRLVMDVKQLTPDEAADWLLDPHAPDVPAAAAAA